MSQFYDQASLVIVPSGYKSGKIYSQKPLSTSGELSFSRASNATRVVLDASGQKRLEKVRTNLILQSNNFSASSWINNALVTPNNQTSPDGTLDADTFTSDGINNGVLQVLTIPNVTHTFSIYAKAGNYSIFRIVNVSSLSNAAWFNLSTGTTSSAIGGTSKIEALPNGWYRCSYSTNSPNTTVSTQGFVLSDAMGSTGAPSVGSTMYFWNSQIETGDIATDYIATTSAAVSVGPVSGLPRLDYSGGASCPSLLLEPQRTNAITFSENQGPSGTNWYPSTTWTVTKNTVTSPSGYQDADTLTETATFDFHSSYFNAVIANAYTGTYTISAFAKYNGRLFVLSPKGGAERTYFNLQTGTIAQLGGGGVTAKIEDYGSGWYRCSVTCSFSAENVNFEHLLASAAGTLQYTGDGTSGVHIWGCQAEAGAYATSYIPTLSSAVTRVADAASKTGISSLIGQTEGTMFVEIEEITKETGGYYLEISDNSNANRILIQNGSGANRINIYAQSAAGTQVNISPTDTFVGRVKIAIAYANNDFKVYANGSEVVSETSFDVPTCSKLSVGVRYNNTSQLGGNVNQALLFKTRLSNADLATLTTL